MRLHHCAISGASRRASYKHDVDIIYDVTLPSPPRIRERVRWLAAEQLERVDGPHKSTTIFNRRTNEITLLSSADRTFRQLDMPRQPQEPAPEATLKRGNETVVAGLHCVEWSWTEDVETRTVCIMADGVLLRFLVDSKTVSEARSVSYRLGEALAATARTHCGGWPSFPLPHCTEKPSGKSRLTAPVDPGFSARSERDEKDALRSISGCRRLIRPPPTRNASCGRFAPL